MSKYRKIQLIALIVELLALFILGLHRYAAPLPDWAVRLNGAIMLGACAVMTFAGVRRCKRDTD